MVQINHRFKKKLGQNFIIDENILNRIILESNISKNALVIEVGSGSGVLTKKLSESSKNVIGYEIDIELSKYLGKLPSNVEIIYGDFLKRDILKDIEKYNNKDICFVSNLPYYITTPIITKLTKYVEYVDKLVIMIQKEAFERLSAKPCTKEYNVINVLINYYYNITKLFSVSRNVFIPKPNVDSVVISLLVNKNRTKLLNENLFIKLVNDSFSQKRKNLKNNLKAYDFDKIRNVLTKYGFNDNVRAEEMDVEIFVEIANELSV